MGRGGYLTNLNREGLIPNNLNREVGGCLTILNREAGLPNKFE